MSDQQDKLSSLLDEFSRDEKSRQVLDEVESDVNLQRRLFRFQMIGQTLRGELPGHIDPTFSASVMAKIDQLEQTPEIKDKTISQGKFRLPVPAWPLLKPFAGPAVAFSVALVAVNFWHSITGKVDVEIAENENGMQWQGKTLAVQQKLNAYLVNHVEYSNSIQGLIPQVRVVGYDVQRVQPGPVRQE